MVDLEERKIHEEKLQHTAINKKRNDLTRQNLNAIDNSYNQNIVTLKKSIQQSKNTVK